ncbi:MAG: TetR/AcrR family transcriptional regulator [Lachnospiraceae bacterium]|nr:TetR/AcrR family transcriptional regulator [Lachnospiraceae bacterium]
MVSENLRVVISKKMMKDGLLRCIKHRSIDRLSISELCRESQVNRATFYNHYSSPKEILTEIIWDYAKEVQRIAESNRDAAPEERLTKCLAYVYDNKDDILTVMRANVDEETTAANLEAMRYGLRQLIDIRRSADLDDQEYELAATGYCRAVQFMLRQWFTEDIDKTPREIAALMMKLPPAKIYK